MCAIKTPKVDEILNERYGIPAAYIDGTLDEEKTNWLETKDIRVEYLVQESKNALWRDFKRLQVVLSLTRWFKKLTHCARDLRVHCKKIAELIRDADPPPIGFNNIAATLPSRKLAG